MFFQKIILFLIRVYQKTISLDHGMLKDVFPWWGCRFRPTCSEYTYQAIEKYGLIFGGVKGIKRILRCHPLSSGGYDPLI